MGIVDLGGSGGGYRVEPVPTVLLDVNGTLVDPGPIRVVPTPGWAMRTSSASRVDDAARRITACNLEASL